MGTSYAFRFILKNILIFTVITLLAGATALAGVAAPPNPGPDLALQAEQLAKLKSKPLYKEGELLVKFKKDAPGQLKEKLHKKLGSKKLKAFKSVEVEHIRLKKGLSVEEAVKLYREDPAVDYAEPNFAYEFAAVPNDPSYGSLWNMSRINAPAAWDLTTGSDEVVVAVLDSGIDASHPDLAANLWPGIGYNPATGGNDPVDTYGHGTHVAGTIGATGNNGIGVVGVNWNVDLLACKIGDTVPYTSYALSCLDFVREQKDLGVNIVATNNSWGGTGYSQSLYDAIAAQQDILLIAAAGNDSSNNDGSPYYPASYDLPNVIAVAATTSNDKLATFSNFGKQSVMLGAPGDALLSTTLNGGYGYMMGTSMATPHVAGLAALLKAQDPSRDGWAIRNLILAGGQDLADLQDITVTGRRIDAYGSAGCVDTPYLLPLKMPETLVPGTPFDFRILSINCADAVGPLSVSTSDGGSFALLDDGVAPDQVAGDGIFAATWTPGETSLRFTISSPEGETSFRIPGLAIATGTLPNANLDLPYTTTSSRWPGDSPPMTTSRSSPGPSRTA